jgi:hypothetical protein
MPPLLISDGNVRKKKAVGNDMMTNLEERIPSDWCRFVKEA